MTQVPTAIDKHYDLIIIGAGSGNSIAGEEFADKSIAIIEKGRFGGTCLNVGCIPTKMFVYASEVAQIIRDSARFGINSHIDSIDWPSIRTRVFADRIDPIAQSGEDYRRGDQTPNINVYDGHAHFVGEKTIATKNGATDVIISGEQIVIATGARPNIPEQIEKSGVRYYTNENIMRIADLPQSMIILGGGFIAMEFAHVFHSLGVKVHIVNRSASLLRHLDKDISTAFTDLTSQAMDAHLGRKLETIEEKENRIFITLDDGTHLDADLLLVATGRTPNGDQLDLDQAGVEMTGNRIKVDKYGRTTAEGVWALGDVSSPYQLKHVANAEMRAIKHNLLHADDLRELPHKFVPAGIFTHPEIATVGLTEEEARTAGINITVKIQKYGDVAYGWAMEDSTGFVKLIANKDTGRLIGAHFFGPQATTLIHQLITVMAFDLDVREVARDQYWIHPALAELTENALLGLEF
nr:mycothione reductase [Corynebacterium kutscheri]